MSGPPQGSPEHDKQALRRQARERRRTAAAAAGPGAAALAAERFLGHITVAGGAVVAGYSPVREEMDPGPLLRRLAEAGCALALPAVEALQAPLVFRRWQPGSVLEPSRFGIPAPPAAAALVVPDLVLVPLLAFDAEGYRLGYGGGFYDRTLAALRQGGPVLAVGFAFAAQECGRVPRQPWDQPLDWVVTERQARKIR